VLTDIEAHFEGVDVTEQLPERIPDVFSEKPIMICGRYQQGGKGELVLTGKLGGQPWSERIPLDFGERSDAPAIPTLWARRKVDDLTSMEPYESPADGKPTARETITDTALEFGIMSAYTSFVAVEKKIVNIDGRQRTVAVPVEMADGVSYEGIFGPAQGGPVRRFNIMHANPQLVQSQVSGSLAGGRGGAGGGFGGGGFGGGAAGTATTMGLVPADKGQLTTPATVANGQKITDTVKATNYAQKVAKKLHDAKGTVEIQIRLKVVDDESVKKLKDLGFKVYDSDKRLKVVFGTCDAKKLLDLAQLDCVRLISPL
jgi:Ca-activated chloride channel family protein